MAKDFKEINAGSRTALVKSSNIYGGQILTAIATAPEGAIYDLGVQTSNPYTVRAEITSNGNGDGGAVLLTFYGSDNGNGEYSDWVYDSIAGDFSIGRASDLATTINRIEFAVDDAITTEDGKFYYNVGEEIYIDMTQFSERNSGLDITGFVTSIYPDRNYGYSFNHQILYDRYDRKMYIKIINDDGSEEVIDFNGVPYAPTVLPGETSFISFTRISSTEILFNYSNAATKIESVSANEDITIYRSLIYQNSIRVLTNENIEYGTTYQFTLSFIDVLGQTIVDEVNVNIEDPGGTGENWGFGSYIAWTGSPYFLDESYHMVVYTYDDLVNMGLDQGSGVISRIGFPFHLVSGQGDNLSNEDIENGSFVLSASITGIGDTNTITAADVINNYIIDDEFDTNILDVNSSKLQGVVETYNGQRYVFFQVSSFTWDVTENILITYWMDGPQPASGGYNGGYITSGVGVQEVLGFSKANNWTGENGVANEKVALAFTTLIR
jgi:hypothetical protein